MKRIKNYLLLILPVAAFVYLSGCKTRLKTVNAADSTRQSHMAEQSAYSNYIKTNAIHIDSNHSENRYVDSSGSIAQAAPGKTLEIQFDSTGKLRTIANAVSFKTFNGSSGLSATTSLSTSSDGTLTSIKISDKKDSTGLTEVSKKSTTQE